MLQWSSLQLLLMRPHQMAALNSKVTQLYPEKHSSLQPRAQTALLDHIQSFCIFTPLPATLWDTRWWEYSLISVDNDKWVLPKELQLTTDQLTFLILWLLCPTEKKLLITGSYFSWAFGEKGNKKIKGTHWGKFSSMLNCWYSMDTETHANDSSHRVNSLGRGWRHLNSYDALG